jgi:class 3 adenylate cyclase
VGERKYLTVLCADLQRSTDLISGLDPEEAISRLEPALIAMRTAVRRDRGIVSNEGGDGLIALFGAPHADDNHAVMACEAWLGCTAKRAKTTSMLCSGRRVSRRWRRNSLNLTRPAA